MTLLNRPYLSTAFTFNTLLGCHYQDVLWSAYSKCLALVDYRDLHKHFYYVINWLINKYQWYG